MSCGPYLIHAMPVSYRAILDVPVSIPGLAMTDKQADTLLRHLHEAGDMDRVIYARFNLRTLIVEPLRRPPQAGHVEEEAPQEYTQPGLPAGERRINVKAQLDSVFFYEDKAETKLIMTFEP
jgi:hypothetical protein